MFYGVVLPKARIIPYPDVAHRICSHHSDMRRLIPTYPGLHWSVGHTCHGDDSRHALPAANLNNKTNKFEE